jgi:DNA repair exonuclease SbcCD nuclease subunit
MIIAHTADIHIRSLSRHEEYKDAFERFKSSCIENKVNHVFLGGDIFHTKTLGISPEYIDLLTWWLTGLAEHFNVHIILGNHDGNLANLSRQDAVSPIVDAIGSERIFLYKKSGTYQIEPGYNFCVFSIFDEDNWNKAKPIPGDVNIACYHGSVRGCVLENENADWVITTSINTQTFKDYDFTFLGDIHKTQFLDFREDKNGNVLATMGYPGTLLQQNYSEDVKRGYFLWQIDSRDSWDVGFVEIENKAPFITIEWNGSINNTLKSMGNIVKGTRVRIKSDVHINQKDVQEISRILKNNLGACEVIFKYTKDEKSTADKLVSTNKEVFEKNDLSKPDVLLGLIKQYHFDTSIDVDGSDIWESVFSELKRYLNDQTLLSVSQSRNIKWAIKNIKFDNLFSYGEDNYINFENLNGIVGIFGPNRAGKSSIVGSLMYSLFNTSDRGSMKNMHICNIRKPFCYSRVELDVNGKGYLIERQTVKNENKKRGTINATTALNLFEIDSEGNQIVDLVGLQRSDTEKNVRELIGTSEDFLMTSFASQGEMNLFIESGATKRRQMLTKFLGLDIFDRLSEFANKDYNAFKSQFKTFSDVNYELEIEKEQEKKVHLSKSVDELSYSYTLLNEKLFELKTLLSKHTNDSPVTQFQINDHKNKLLNKRNELSKLISEESKVNSDIASLNVSIEKMNSLRGNHDIDSLKERVSAYRRLESAISTMQHSYERELTILKGYQKQSKILNEVPCGDLFPKCKFIADGHIAKLSIQEQTQKVELSLSNLNEVTKSLEVIKSENVVDKLEKLEKLSELFSKTTIQLIHKKNEIEKIQSQISVLGDIVSELEKTVHSLELAALNSENAELIMLKNEIDDVHKKISKINENRMNLSTEMGKSISRIEKYVHEKEKKNDVIKNMKIYDLISSSFSKKGVPNIILQSQLPMINREISQILSGVVDFTVEIDIDDETESMDIYINYGDSRRIIELCSGMEKMISSIAIRVALINVSTFPKTNLFIVDEGFGALDDLGIEACNRLLQSLTKFFKTIMIITHIDSVKDVADVILEITKNEKDSRVHYI